VLAALCDLLIDQLRLARAINQFLAFFSLIIQDEI
jgi:hypothetical protein